MVGNAIAQSAQPIISYNYGLGYKDRVIATEHIALLTAVVCSSIVTLAFTFYPGLLVGLFISQEDEAARIAVSGFPYFSSGFVFFVVNIAIVGYFQSVERIRPATLFFAWSCISCTLFYSVAEIIGCARDMACFTFIGIFNDYSCSFVPFD